MEWYVLPIAQAIQLRSLHHYRGRERPCELITYLLRLIIAIA
ncbi:MAG: hypothetical protein V7K26_15880 [Nostoc sp.]